MSATHEIAKGLVAAHVVSVLNCKDHAALSATTLTQPSMTSDVTAAAVLDWCRAAVASGIGAAEADAKLNADKQKQ